MRILYLSKAYTPHDYRILDVLSRSDHEVFYLRLEEGAMSAERRPLPPGIRPILWKGAGSWWTFPWMLRNLRRVLRDLKPDVVHAGPVQQGAFLIALAGYRPLVTMSWGSDILIDARRGFGRWAACYTLNRSSALICDCDVVRQKAIQLGMPADKIVVFPWGVDLDLFSPGSNGELRSKLGWESAFVLLSNRSMEPIYGVDIVVKAFIRAVKIDEELRLILLNDGPLRYQFQTLIRKAGLEDRVYFAGRIENDKLPAYYRAADLYLSGSHSDGSSVSLLEAMACGVPVVVSDIAGNREWVTPGENGWWFPDGDEEALADMIRVARKAPKGLSAIADRARAVAEERANWRRNSRKLLEVYKLVSEAEENSL